MPGPAYIQAGQSGVRTWISLGELLVGLNGLIQLNDIYVFILFHGFVGGERLRSTPPLSPYTTYRGRERREGIGKGLGC